MLPFLKSKEHQQAGVITQVRPSDNPDSSTKDEGLRACSRELIRAVGEGDEAGVASALRAAFQILDSDHTNESDE